jgi:transposase
MESAALQDQAMPGISAAMVEPEIVRQIRALDEFGWSSRRIARELGVNRGTVKRYVRGAPVDVQHRPTRRVLPRRSPQSRPLMIG